MSESIESSQVREPSFFIVGAPKCGTTALCKYLNRHPDIFIPQLKELHYFDTDLKTKQKAASWPDYLALFAGGEGKICGEGSPTYLYSKAAVADIFRFNPDAKIIIMLRDPVEMMYAFHSQHLFNGSSETVKDFATALALEADRKQGRHIPRRCQEPHILLYRDFARYFEQVKRYLDTFGAANIQIILFEDFKSSTATIFRETLEFLGVDPDFTTDFTAKNANKTVRSSVVQTLVKYPPSQVLAWGKYLLPLPQSTRRAWLEGIKTWLKQMNTQQAPRPTLDMSLRRQLMAEMKPDIQQLEGLIARDLSHWYQLPR